ncbi:hypothetical protein BDV41DRAFT_538813 [Aspergillus transmontanensis]|uniref:Uncharacterized protein n=1 Tax=Aspergillus transmontanensis TaxID=1034304 RepID=A0A5N6VY23_9EURO|nr:hypothetical protein BDV41DRAFT_538813 [Aspergillus transmontanensis]
MLLPSQAPWAMGIVCDSLTPTTFTLSFIPPKDLQERNRRGRITFCGSIATNTLQAYVEYAIPVVEPTADPPLLETLPILHVQLRQRSSITSSLPVLHTQIARPLAVMRRLPAQTVLGITLPLILWFRLLDLSTVRAVTRCERVNRIGVGFGLDIAILVVV